MGHYSEVISKNSQFLKKITISAIIRDKKASTRRTFSGKETVESRVTCQF